MIIHPWALAVPVGGVTGWGMLGRCCWVSGWVSGHWVVVLLLAGHGRSLPGGSLQRRALRASCLAISRSAPAAPPPDPWGFWCWYCHSMPFTARGPPEGEGLSVMTPSGVRVSSDPSGFCSQVGSGWLMGSVPPVVLMVVLIGGRATGSAPVCEVTCQVVQVSSRRDGCRGAGSVCAVVAATCDLVNAVFRQPGDCWISEGSSDGGVGRDGRARTGDLLVPNQAPYRWATSRLDECWGPPLVGGRPWVGGLGWSRPVSWG